MTDMGSRTEKALREGPQAVQALTEQQFAFALETLVAAFIEDPMAGYFFPDTRRRANGLRWVFNVTLRYGLRCGEVDTLKEGRGVAIWLRSEQASMGPIQMMCAGMVVTPLVIGWGATLRLLKFLRFIEKRRLSSVSGPHWYLLSLAVFPENQAQGLGSALVKYGIARARAQRRPCFLETTNERNVTYYQKFGFSVTREGRASGAGPRVWSLLASCV